MLKVYILGISSHCNSEVNLHMGETEDSQGRKYTCYTPCNYLVIREASTC